MKIIKKINFDRVEAIKLGYGFLTRPIMNVHCFIVDGILIDTAQSLMRKDLMSILKTRKIDKVLLTHFHEDHSGNAAEIKRSFNIPVYGHPLTIKKMGKGYRILPFQHLMWGKADLLDMELVPPIIKGNSIELEPVHTPGHSKDHTVYYEKKQGWLFSGDLYLADKIKYFRADENFHDTIASLKKVLSLDFNSLFCAHCPQPAKGRKLILKKLEYLKNFKGETNRLHKQGHDIKSIIEKMNMKEAALIKLFTFGNVSLAHMVRSSIE